MAIPPKFALSHRIGAADSKHTLEFFLDYVCPYSGKQWRSLNEFLRPQLKEGQASIVFRQIAQPWFTASHLLHEAALGVATIAPQQFWSYSAALFEHQKEYNDETCSQESPAATRERLATLAQEVAGVDKAALIDLISANKGASHGGSKITMDLKQTIKYSRQNSIHVSPTVLLDGVIDPSISSSFTKEDWAKYIEDKLN